MLAITVEFKVASGFENRFIVHVKSQAAASLTEPACLQFDVCVDTETPNRVFLYERYADDKAFAKHLLTPHFLDFDAETKDWVLSKTIRRWHVAND